MTRAPRDRRRAPARSDGDAATGPGSGPDADPYSVARTIVLNRLNAAPRTRAELATTLAERGTPDDVATAVLDRMTEVGLIDDAEYARMWVGSRHSGRGLARRALAQELRKKGVSDDDAAAALEEVDAEAERSRAVELVRRKAPSSRGLDRDRRTRRLVGMLARKGYSPGLAFAVVRDVLDAEDGTDDSPDDWVEPAPPHGDGAHVP